MPSQFTISQHLAHKSAARTVEACQHARNRRKAEMDALWNPSWTSASEHADAAWQEAARLYNAAEKDLANARQRLTEAKEALKRAKKAERKAQAA
jgi:hypothetical protein